MSVTLPKIPSHLSRVLVDDDCPPFDEPHDIDDYPGFYDPLYYPSLFPEIFSDSGKLCDWLLSSLREHLSLCRFVHQLLSVRELSLDDDHFYVQLDASDEPIAIPLSFFVSASYSHCRAIQLLDSSLQVPSLHLHVKSLLHKNPSYLSVSERAVVECLSSLPTGILRASCTQHCPDSIRTRMNKSKYASALANHYLSTCAYISHTRSSALCCQYPTLNRQCPRFMVVSEYLECMYGRPIASPLKSLLPSPAVSLRHGFPLLWKHSPQDCALILERSQLTLEVLQHHFDNTHCSIRVRCSRKTRRQLCSSIVSTIVRRCQYLDTLSVSDLLTLSLNYSYSFSLNKTQHSELKDIYMSVIAFECGCDVVQHLRDSTLRSRYDSQSLWHRNQRKQDRVRRAHELQNSRSGNTSVWPQVVPLDVKLECACQYYQATQWTEPDVCAVCSQFQRTINYVSVPRVSLGCDPSCELHWDKLEIADDFIITNCILASVSNEFNFGNPHLDGLMLDKAGVSYKPSEGLDQVNVCRACYSALKSGKVPRLSLRNNLYRGRLPDDTSGRWSYTGVKYALRQA